MALLIVLTALAAAAALLWFIGSREPVYALRSNAPCWFIALKTNALSPRDCAPGADVLWAASSDFALIGAQEAYWTHFMIVSSAAPPQLAANSAVKDAYVARFRMFRPPRFALGALKATVWMGLQPRPPRGPIADPSQLNFRAALMPSAESVAELLAKPADYAPIMVNFLEYLDRTPGGEPGAVAYRRYGRVALRTVYGVGGSLIFYGQVEQVVRVPRSGPTLGRWNELAAMRYPNPPAILSMERAPAYRAALAHRDAGLARTVVIASRPC
jgi:hypothetical protein